MKVTYSAMTLLARNRTRTTHLFRKPVTDNVISHTRQTCLPRICLTNPNVYTFNSLFNNRDINVLNKMCTLVKVIQQRVQLPGFSHVHVSVQNICIYLLRIIYYIFPTLYNVGYDNKLLLLSSPFTRPLHILIPVDLQRSRNRRPKAFTPWSSELRCAIQNSRSYSKSSPKYLTMAWPLHHY
jgi:hypothetical protein